MFTDATTRFSDRVENYIRYRPGYPPSMMTFLQARLHLAPAHIIADIGSGTGKSSEPFLLLENQVLAVEPNQEMRQAAERLLGHFPNFRSVNGSAEASTLPDQAADFVVAGTAFHWFEPQATRREFRRILKPEGWVLLVWNVRDNDASEFMMAYENFLLQHATDYSLVREVYHDTAGFDAFFENTHWQQATFENVQNFDFEGLVGRYLSCSYAFPENHPNFATAKAALRVIFDKYQENGLVSLWYNTALYYGKL